MRWWLFLLVLFSGCRSYSLDEKWRPLTRVQECPFLTQEIKAVTIGETLYVKNYKEWRGDDNVALEVHLIHEQTHSLRQREHIFGWLWNYITDKEFMKHEEQVAFYAQIEYLKQHNLEYKIKFYNDFDYYSMYKNLDGQMFNNKEEVDTWFKEMESGKWRP